MSHNAGNTANSNSDSVDGGNGSEGSSMGSKMRTRYPGAATHPEGLVAGVFIGAIAGILVLSALVCIVQ